MFNSLQLTEVTGITESPGSVSVNSSVGVCGIHLSGLGVVVLALLVMIILRGE